MATTTSAPSSATAEADSQSIPVRQPLRRAGVEAALAAPVQIFQGYDSVVGTGLGTAIQGTTQAVGARSDVTYTGCESIETLSQALEIDQSLSVTFGPFGSVDEKMKFVHKLDVTTTSVSLVVYAKHVTGKQALTDYALKPNVTPPVGNEQLGKFFHGYGDSFLSSVTTGGEYYAVYTFYTQTKAEQTSLVAELKAHGIWSTTKIDASLQLKLDNFTSSTSTRVEFKQSVSGIANPKLPDPDHIIRYALDFPSLPIDAPTIIGFETLGYERVPAIQDFQPIVKNRIYFIGFLGQDAGLTKDLVKLQQLLNQAKWIKGIYHFYGGYTDEKLDRVTKLAEVDIKAIDDQIVAFEDDPTQTFTRPNLQALDYGTPALEYGVGKSPSWGGGGGDPFDDVDIRTALQQKTWLSALQLRTGSLVDRITAVYESDKGSWTDSHGGNGGSPTNELRLLPGQFVVRVSGRSGVLVDNLDVVITDGRHCGGGGGGGDPFDWAVPSGSFVLGFAGRSGAKLDQIAVVHAGFKPAKWTPF